MSFSGRHIWIIGASEGIGAALAAALSREGATLLLSARNAEKLRAVHAGVGGAPHALLPLDVTDTASVAAACDRALSQPKPVDMVIYNAGAYEPMSAMQMDITAIERMIDVNLRGAFRVLARVVPFFLRRGQGHVVLVGSVAGYRGLPAAIGYGASKAALIHLAENLRVDLADTPIRVQVVNPGFVKTRLTDKNDFAMPCIISPERAARYMIAGLRRPGRFEIHFPPRFSYALKTLALLPYRFYFPLIRRL